MALAYVRILDVRILVDGVVHRAVSWVRAAHGTDLIRLRQRVLADSLFSRQESEGDTSAAVAPNLMVSVKFPMHPRIGTRLNPVRRGSFGVACVMTMIHGLPVVGARAGGEPS